VPESMVIVNIIVVCFLMVNFLYIGVMKYLKTYEQHNVTELNYSSQGLEYLPELPEGLKGLSCYNNKLKELPELPEGLTILYCNSNKLKELPDLPEGLKDLYCNNNKLPFNNLVEYNEWYKENEYLIKTQGLSYAYELSNSINKYNV